jgi:hypothetical protein
VDKSLNCPGNLVLFVKTKAVTKAKVKNLRMFLKIQVPGLQSQASDLISLQQGLGICIAFSFS